MASSADVSDNHALTRREAVGLNDQRERLGSNVRAGGVEIRKRCVRRRGYAVAVHKGLRIDFGALKRGRRPARAKAPESRLVEAVHDPGHQRRLRSDQGEVNPSAPGEGEERREIAGRDGGVFNLGFARRAGVPRRHVDAIDMCGARHLPREGVLAPSPADD